MQDEKKTIGQKIKLFRKREKLTQAELAEKIGISEKHISKIELGVYFPTLNNFVKILNVLNLELNDFGFELTPQKNETKEKLMALINESNKSELEFFLTVVEATKKLI